MLSLFDSDFSVYLISVKCNLKVSYRYYVYIYLETTFQVQRADILIINLRNSSGPLIVVIKPKANKNICNFCMKKIYPQHEIYHFFSSIQ